MSLCFEAAAEGGTLRLALPCGAGDAVAAALALAEHEALIVALEGWLQQPLDPRPAPAAGAGEPLLWARSGVLRLGFPWALLAAAPAAPMLPVEWPELSFEIDVAGFDAAPRPADAGAGVLLLPPAFEPAWRVLLHAGTLALVAEAEWRGPGEELALFGPPQTGLAQRAAWRVQLDARLQRSLPELLGWVAPAAPPRPDGAARLVGPDGAARAGNIAPALGGAGLWIAA
jgi:hypothetical protein